MPLGELVTSKDAQRVPLKESDRALRKGTVPYYGASGIIDYIDQHIFEGPHLLVAEDGANLLSRSTPVALEAEGKFWVNNHAHVLLPKEEVELRYLLHFLSNCNLVPYVSGTAQPKLTYKNLARIPIPLPPRAELKRIAEVLDRAEALRAKRRAALAQLDSLTQSLFLDLYRGVAKELRVVLFSDLAESTRGAFVNGPFGSDLLTSELQEEGVPVIYIRDIRDGEYRRVSSAFVSERKARDLQVCSVLPGDVLVAKVGDPPGVAAIYPKGEPHAIITQDVIRIRPNSEVALAEYIVGYLNSSIGQWKVGGITIEATRARFSLGDFKRMTIELPPLPLQQEFACRVTAIERLKTAHRASLVKLDALFASLQHRAFRGEL